MSTGRVNGKAEDLPAALSGLGIVCVGFAEWDADIWTNQQHLMARLGVGNRVLFVESLGLRRPQLAGRDLRRLLRRLWRGLRGPRSIDGVSVLSPLVIPLHSSPLVQALNARLLRIQVRRAVRRQGIGRPLLWAYVPQAEALVSALDPALVIYHCVDDIAEQKGVDAQRFRAAEERFANRADLIIASAPALAARMRATGSEVIEAPNVADTELFSRALGAGPLDPALQAIPSPRLVFVGAVTRTKIDLALLRDVALLRPDWSIALVGPLGAGDPSTDISSLEEIPNVHFLGPRAQEDLPAVLRGASVGLIPYAINPLTRSVFPMKVYEYLAAGLGVVSTPLPALAAVEGIERAVDAEQTVERVEYLLAADGPGQRRARSQLASTHSWETRISEIADALDGIQR